MQLFKWLSNIQKIMFWNLNVKEEVIFDDVIYSRVICYFQEIIFMEKIWKDIFKKLVATTEDVLTS